jgi:hypothetical protein
MAAPVRSASSVFPETQVPTGKANYHQVRLNGMSARTVRIASTLLALHDTGIRIDGQAMQGWALANGWSR